PVNSGHTKPCPRWNGGVTMPMLCRAGNLQVLERFCASEGRVRDNGSRSLRSRPPPPSHKRLLLRKVDHQIQPTTTNMGGAGARKAHGRRIQARPIQSRRAPMPELRVSLLVVDDEEPIRNALKRYLTKQDFEVFTAGSGEEALQMLQDHED